ncbi:MAG: glycosyltransferase family 2 protein [Caldisphaeraceae archaeon]|nr:glycosyltransferase family 2 protein [Caldisphaeraceae archaeon]
MVEDLISVIVTAHNRKKFLPEALRSLEKQSLDKSRFEVIVVKNFYDKVSDEIIERNNWKNIVTDEESLGGKIFLALKHCRGSIVTFLEDDDLYRQDRLEKIYEAFKKHDMVFFYNDQEFIDEEGRVIKKVNPTINKTLVVPHNLKKRLSGYFDHYHLGFNSSSMAMKTRCIKRLSGLIKRLTPALDTLIYLASFVCYGDIFINKERLTLYRVHGSSTTCWISHFNSYKAWLDCRQRYVLKYLNGHAYIAFLYKSLLGIYPNIYSSDLLDFAIFFNMLQNRNKPAFIKIPARELVKHIRFKMQSYLYVRRVGEKGKWRATAFMIVALIRMVLSSFYDYLLGFLPLKIKDFWMRYIYYGTLRALRKRAT